MEIGGYIRAERKRLELTQASLADLIGTTGQSVSNIERGRSKPSRNTLRNLARVFGKSLDELDALCGDRKSAAA